LNTIVSRAHDDEFLTLEVRLVAPPCHERSGDLAQARGEPVDARDKLAVATENTSGRKTKYDG
jgi:hypothetical protein